MRYISLILSLLLLTFASFALAKPVTDNMCDRLEGPWFGTFTIRDNAECQKAKGCTHGVTVLVSRLSEDTFHADAMTSKGIVDAFNITCSDNYISIHGHHRHGNVRVSCTTKRLCVAKFDDESVSATVLNVKL